MFSPNTGGLGRNCARAGGGEKFWDIWGEGRPRGRRGGIGMGERRWEGMRRGAEGWEGEGREGRVKGRGRSGG